jgi:membrane associated rhomboid family serine protease
VPCDDNSGSNQKTAATLRKTLPKERRQRLQRILGSEAMSSQNEPPPPNPILTAYETFVRDTPLVTRYTITVQFVSWFVSFFVDPSFAIGNIPYFTIFKFELYRIVLSPLICQSLLSLVFAYITFVDHGKRLEFSMGSTAFAWLMLTLAVSTNVVFLLICFTLYGLGGDERFLHMHSSGIWTILFGLIAIECSKAPTGSKRRLFFCEIPTLYYPLGLLAIFSMFAGFLLAFYISAGVGYAYG